MREGEGGREGEWASEKVGEGRRMIQGKRASHAVMS